MMNLQELQTIATNKLPVKIIVFDNGGYHSIRQTQNNYFPDNLIGFDASCGISFPNFIRLAEAFGIPSRRCERASDINAAFRFAAETAGPVLLQVMLDPTKGFEPKLASRMLPDGRMASPALEDMAPFLSREELRENMFIPLME